jgi:hypothetical protein
LIIPLKPVLKSDGCRYIQNVPGCAFVTRSLNKFSDMAVFEAIRGVSENMPVGLCFAESCGECASHNNGTIAFGFELSN